MITVAGLRAASNSITRRLDTGLCLIPANPRTSVIGSLASAISVAAFVVALDAILFRSELSASYLARMTSPNLGGRIVISMWHSLTEEILFRGVMMFGGLALWALLAGRKPPTAAVIATIILAQFANAGPGILAAGFQYLPYQLLRFMLPGIVWGWLCWRQGWLSAAVAHPAAHLIIQPLLLVALR